MSNTHFAISSASIAFSKHAEDGQSLDLIVLVSRNLGTLDRDAGLRFRYNFGWVGGSPIAMASRWPQRVRRLHWNFSSRPAAKVAARKES